MREEELINQLLTLVDKVSLNELGMRHQLEQEVERYHKFRTSVLGNKKEPTKRIKEIDMKNYAKYILRDGTVMEKRSLLASLKTRLVFKEKTLLLEQ